MIASVLPVALASILPVTAMAEGAVQDWACTVTQHCTVAGACSAAGEAVTFRMMPREVSPDGIGSYDVTYGDQTARAEWLRPFGPILWTDAEQKENTLMISTETDMLWHILDTADPWQGEIRFLTCEVTL